MGEDRATSISEHPDISIDQKLIEEGTQQLTSEINVLEAWLEELEQSNNSDVEIKAARKSYSDMLRSRKEMLSSLTQQAKMQTSARK